MPIRDIIRRKSPSEIASLERMNPLAMLRNQMDRFMEDFWTDWPGMPQLQATRGAFVPSIDVSEDEKSVDITAELPGMSEQDFEVTLSPNASMLTIKGEKKFEEEKRSEQFYRFERSYGAFKRMVPLPSAVDDKNAEAKFKDGVLRLHFPKLSEKQQGIRKIEVKGG